MNKAFTIWTQKTASRIYRGQNGYIIIDGMQVVAMAMQSFFAKDYMTLRTINGSPRPYTIKRHD